jgi:hypothetical protein
VCALVLPKHTRSAPYTRRRGQARLVRGLVSLKTGAYAVSSTLLFPPSPHTVETINSAADFALSCGDHRSRDLAPQTSPTIRSWIAEGLLFGCRSRLLLPSTSIFSRARLPPIFWLSARHLCCFSPTPPNNKMCTPLLFYQHLFSLHHPLTQPHFTQPPVIQPVLCAVHPTPRQHPVTHPLCHTPNPFHPLPLLLPLPSTIIHVPIWCRGRSPSTGPHAPCSLNGTDSVSCSAYATTRSGLSSTPPPVGCCGTDQIFRPPS